MHHAWPHQAVTKKLRLLAHERRIKNTRKKDKDKNDNPDVPDEGEEGEEEHSDTSKKIHEKKMKAHI